MCFGKVGAPEKKNTILYGTKTHAKKEKKLANHFQRQSSWWVAELPFVKTVVEGTEIQSPLAAMAALRSGSGLVASAYAIRKSDQVIAVLPPHRKAEEVDARVRSSGALLVNSRRTSRFSSELSILGEYPPRAVQIPRADRPFAVSAKSSSEPRTGM
jgi:hypothetical protein